MSKLYKLSAPTIASILSFALLTPVATAGPSGNFEQTYSNVKTPSSANKIVEGEIIGDYNSFATQNIILENGVKATVEVDAVADSIRITADNGENYQFKLSELRSYVQNGDAEEGAEALRKKPNSCQVATGIAGIAHSALWGAAVGGPAGAAAGAAVGAFWWGVGSQC
ncbi:hypothetical protein GC425_05425 [Corynebacterium sp. zg254]|uniref:Uncharacterized protein n=1 Tax=Corynebacterium zhongnanshanii TaxID=2768834 RepID=A0ABQ6VJI6_9CORY|nr:MULTISPECIES: hypothetical protein [Corynebacterium]KAB3522646.1 hypothetical protein F8377_00180 [Corynebacterium zhongnanshanii]MCR5914305.1 hypothetical protein [Corynebacterium sp. zg254]